MGDSPQDKSGSAPSSTRSSGQTTPPEASQATPASSPQSSNPPTSNLVRQGSVVASMTLISRISGFVRDVVLSYLFGASVYADVFFVALRVPNFFRRLFAEGAFSQAFVPVMVRYREEGQAALRAFLAPLLGLFGLALLIFTGLAEIFARALTALFAPGFLDTPDVFDQTVDLVRITFPYLAFISLSAYAGALLNAHQRFAVPAVTPVLLNLSLLGAATLVLMGWVDDGGTAGITVLAWGVFVAGVLQLAVQLPALGSLGLLVKPSADTSHPGVRQVGKLLIPAVFSASVSQINALVNTILASTLITGSISWLYFADRLMELPLGLVAVALGTVMLPHLSRLAAQGREADFHRTMDWGVFLGLLLGMPAAVALYLLAEPLSASVFMAFDGGAMRDTDIRMVGLALEFFAVALPGFVLVKVLAPGFFAHQDTQSPFRYALAAVIVNLLGSLLTFTWFGHVGLALATALSAWAHVLFLLTGIRRAGHYRPGPMLKQHALRIGVATVCVGGVIYFWVAPLPWLQMQGLPRLGWMLLVVAGIAAVYALILVLLGLRPRHLLHRV